MKRIFYLFLFVLFPTVVFPQSNGINEVRQVESKAQQIQENKIRVTSLRDKLPELQREFQAKIRTIQTEMDDLIRERDSRIADMKVGARCSECDRWKTDLEAAGINFQDHLRDVRGTPIPATTSELEQIRKEFSERIAVKKVQINRASASDPLAAAKKEISDLEATNVRLCEEIYKHAQNYTKILSAQIKDLQSEWMRELFQQGESVLISQDLQLVYMDRRRRLKAEFEQQALGIKTDLEKEAATKIDEVETERKKVENDISLLIASELDRKTLAEQTLVNLTGDIRRLEVELTKSFVPDSTKAQVSYELSELKNRKTSLESDNSTNSQKNLELKHQLEGAIRNLSEEIQSLNSELPKVITDQTAQLKVKYDAEISKNEQLLQNTMKETPIQQANFKKVKASLSAKNQDFHEVITSETNRIAIASQKINCYVTEGSRGELVDNWNKRIRCITDVVENQSVSSYSSAKAGDFCHPSAVASQLSNYISFLNTLSKEDFEAVRLQKNSQYLEFLGLN